MKIAILLLLSSLFYSYPTAKSSSPTKTQSVAFEITNIRNTKGNFVLCFFSSEANYEAGKECIRKEFSKKNIYNGELNIAFDLPQGNYGVVLLDDENLNDEMDYGFLLPLEGFGFSNHVPMIRKPRFSDIQFNVSESSSRPITIKVKYM